MENIKMDQELQHLRDELNQRLSFFYEHSQKTINMVLIAWGGILAILGVTKSFEAISCSPLLLFISGTIFFISNLMLYFSTLKGNDNINCVFKISAYIAKFYEKKPGKDSTTDSFCWETTSFELQPKDNFGTHIYIVNSWYAMALMIVSTLGLMFFMFMFFENIFRNCGFNNAIEVVTLLIYVGYFFVSILLLCKICKYIDFKYISNIKDKYFEEFSCCYSNYTKGEIE